MKRALCIGTNYPGTSSQLQGCVNDAQDWIETLDRLSFDVYGITDEGASRHKILEHTGALLEVSGKDDIAVITYSGHGTRVPDTDGDEIDRWDEAIVPTDYHQAGFITDDQLYELFSPADARGVRVVFIADCCFSGTIQRLAPSLASPDLDRFETAFAYRAARWLPPQQWMGDQQYRELQLANFDPRGRPRRSALAFTGAKDTQVAYDAYLDGRYRGAFTAAAIQALTMVEGPTRTYRQWYRDIRTILPSVDFDQVPQLDGTSTQKRWLLFEGKGAR